MDKEKEIEEVYDIIDDTIYIQYDWLYGKREAAENIVEAGYRKAYEVRKETAKEILRYLKATITDGLLKNHEILNALMREYGIEVDE